MVLEAGDEVIGITHHDHVASGRVPSPARGPEVEGVAQIDTSTSRHLAALRSLAGLAAVSTRWQMPPEWTFDGCRIRIARGKRWRQKYPAGQFGPIGGSERLEANFPVRLEEQIR